MIAAAADILYHPDELMIEVAIQPDSLLGWMGSLADTTRLRLLRLLEQQELGVSDLCEILQMPQSTVSRHLKLLADDRWVIHHRQGTMNLYRMVLDELNPSQRELWVLVREQTRGWATLVQDELRLAQLLERHTRDTQTFFDGAASDWDAIRTEYYGEAFTHDAVMALLPSQWLVADLGCGTGSIAAELSPLVRQVIGVDNSKAMLDAASRRCSGLANVELKYGVLESIPIDNDRCDAALMILVLTYVEDVASVLCEMCRVIKPGGRAVVVDLMRHDRHDFRRRMGQRTMGFDMPELETLMKRSGFRHACCRPVRPQPQAKGPTLLIAAGEK